MSRHHHRRSGGTPAQADNRRLLEYLEEFQSLSANSDLKSFYQTFCNNLDLQQSALRVLQKTSNEVEDTGDDRDTIQTLCQFLLKMLRSTFSQRVSTKTTFIPTSTANDMIKTRIAVLQFVPHFIHLYLIKRASGVKSNYKFIDAFLLSVYNAEASELQSFRMIASGSNTNTVPSNPLIRPQVIKVPPLASSSTYHDSGRLESEDKLDQRPSGLTFHFEHWGFMDNLTASSRPKVFKLLLQTFNRHIVDMQKYSLEFFTRGTVKLLERGYGHQSSTCRRIQMDQPVLLELLFGAYVCMYNGFQVINTIYKHKVT